MVDFCTQRGVELKLFDITFYRDSLSKDGNFWAKNYVSLDHLCQQFEKEFGPARIVHSVGGFGNPMPIYRPDSSSPIRVRTSEVTAQYLNDCVDCPDYMCQDGLCNITLTAEGNLKLCRPQGLDFDLRLTGGNQKLLSGEEMSSVFTKAISLFRMANEKQRTLGQMVKSWRPVVSLPIIS